MEGSTDQILEACRGAIDAMSDDPRITCAQCKARMEFRVDGFYRQEPDTWLIGAFVRRDDGWIKLMKGNAEVGVVCPACQKDKMADFALSDKL